MENQAIAKATNNNLVKSFDLAGNLPNLAEAKEVPADLTSEYWTPEKEGEYKLVFYQAIDPSTYTDEKTGETVDLPCMIAIAQDKDGNLQTIRNGSKRLVAALEDAQASGKIEPGTPLKLTFLGKEKNKTNSYLSDRWSIRPLSA